MSRNPVHLLVTSLSLLICGSGCTGPWRPSLKTVQPQNPAQQLDLVPYLQANRIGRWTYRRHELPIHEDQPAALYSRVIGVDRLTEGDLELASVAEIASYLHRDEYGSPLELPKQYMPKGEAVILLELEEALNAVPPALASARSIRDTTVARWYNWQGRLMATGTVSRVAEVEGFEDVECPAGRFERCLRVRIDLEGRFGLGPNIDWTSYVWLAKEVGEVRRVQRFSGWFLIFWFASAHEFELVAYEGDKGHGHQPSPAPRWWRALLRFDRGFPNPRISALVVDFAPDHPASVPATQPVE